MIIKSKLSVPRQLKNNIVRKRLLTDFSDYKLGLICAPAGYGKSTVASEWAMQQKNLAWFSIDCFDNEIDQFCHYFFHMINQIEGVACPATLEVIKQSRELDLIKLSTLLFDELSEIDIPLCFVLDDYHHIKDHEINRGLSFFIKHMPLNWKLLIASRTAPPLTRFRFTCQTTVI